MNRQPTIIAVFFTGCFILLFTASPQTVQAQGLAPDTTLAGTWITRGPERIAYFSLAPDGTYQIDLVGDNQPDAQGTYTRSDEAIHLVDTGGALACPDPGRYTYRLQDETLTFSPLEDPCDGRVNVMALVEWANQDRLFDYYRAAALNPRDAAAYLHRGRLRLILQDADGAMHDFDKALALDPDNARAYTGRGAWKLLNENDLEGALADFDQALTLDPENGLLYFRRAFVKWHSGDKNGSCEDVKAAIALGVPLEQKYETNCR